jgi:hypothetical protein
VDEAFLGSAEKRGQTRSPRCYLQEYLTLINSLPGSIAQRICRKRSCCCHLPTSHIASIPSSRSIVIQTIESC